MKRDILYSVTCLAFAIIIGGAVYEHMNVIPTWAAAPPVSLTMFQGKYGLNQEIFWMIIHPVNLLLFGVLLTWHWRTARRKNIVVTLSGYAAVLIITSLYFVPELLDITTRAMDTHADPQLVTRARTWEILSLVRLGFLVVLALVLFNGLTKPKTAAAQ